MERKGAATMQGRPVTLIGPEIKKGDTAPDFTCINTRLSPVKLSDSKGKIRVLASVPSLDTTVCSKETIKWNDEAEKLSDGRVVWMTISMDLPFAQKRFIEDEDVQNLVVLSDHREASFGRNYGVLMKDERLLNRAIFVVDDEDTVRYVEYLKENSEFPNFDAALKVITDLLSQSRRAAA
ncbi:MAG: thiol peroxidase [Nitrospirota bacterium]